MKYILTILFFPFLIIGCKTQENVPVKENPPTVFTKGASDVSLFSATLNGEVTDEGFTAATDRGFVYSEKNTNPSVSDLKVQSGYGKGIYLVKVDKLALNTKYYFKAYSTNTKGTAYGEVQNFTTSDYKIPTVTTDVPLNITHFSADLGGSVTDAGGLNVTQRGICYGLNPNPTTSDNKVISGEGLGVFKISLQQLKDNSKYYVRAYAINSKGTAFGNEQIINTLSAPATPRDNTTKVVEVKSKTGRIWMDRNLGATQAATSQYDEKAYGHLYQWGRGADGHQERFDSRILSGSTLLSSTDNPGNRAFIYTPDSPQDWRKPQNDNLWQGINGINNPCPVGYRLPTESEWSLEIATWGNPKSILDAFNSPLKLTLGGYVGAGYGGLNQYGNKDNSQDWDSQGRYWSSSVDGQGSKGILILQSPDVYPNGGSPPRTHIYTLPRACGQCVRCIKD